MPITFNFSRGFVKDFKRLRKRFRFIEQDIDNLMAEMEHESFRGDYAPYLDKKQVRVNYVKAGRKSTISVGDPPARPYPVWTILEISFGRQISSIRS